jgi:hypothetical protein
MILPALQLAGVLSGMFLIAVLLFVIYYIGANPLRRLPHRADAERRAEELLQSQLTPDEYHQLTTQGYLRVPSPRYPNRVYLIPRYRGLVRVYEQGRSVMRLCVGPVEPVPDADVVLMHKLMIQGNEEEYLKTANVF